MKKSVQTVEILKRPKGLVTHYGLKVGPNNVLHIQPGSSFKWVSEQEFSEGKYVSRNLVRDICLQSLQDRIAQLEQNMRRYSHISWNCEDLVTFLLTGKASSKQRNNVLIYGVAGLAVSKAFKIESPWLLFALGALAGVSLSSKQPPEGITRKIPQTVP